MKIQVPCADGSDRHCCGFVEVELPYIGLSTNDITVNFHEEDGQDVLECVQVTPPNPVWVAKNQEFLSPSDLDDIDEYGFFEIKPRDVEAVCGPCGSDQTYDDEGNNISSR
jgi:hypothetical protein